MPIISVGTKLVVGEDEGTLESRKVVLRNAPPLPRHSLPNRRAKQTKPVSYEAALRDATLDTLYIALQIYISLYYDPVIFSLSYFPDTAPK